MELCLRWHTSTYNAVLVTLLLLLPSSSKKKWMHQWFAVVWVFNNNYIELRKLFSTYFGLPFFHVLPSNSLSLFLSHCRLVIKETLCRSRFAGYAIICCCAPLKHISQHFIKITTSITMAWRAVLVCSFYTPLWTNIIYVTSSSYLFLPSPALFLSICVYTLEFFSVLFLLVSSVKLFFFCLPWWRLGSGATTFSGERH